MVLFYCRRYLWTGWKCRERKKRKKTAGEDRMHASIFYAKHCKNVLNFFQLSWVDGKFFSSERGLFGVLKLQHRVSSKCWSPMSEFFHYEESTMCQLFLEQVKCSDFYPKANCVQASKVKILFHSKPSAFYLLLWCPLKAQQIILRCNRQKSWFYCYRSASGALFSVQKGFQHTFQWLLAWAKLAFESCVGSLIKLSINLSCWRSFNLRVHPINFNLGILSSPDIIRCLMSKGGGGGEGEGNFVLLAYKVRNVLFETWLIWIQIRYDFWANESRQQLLHFSGADGWVLMGRSETLDAHIIYHNPKMNMENVGEGVNL